MLFPSDSPDHATGRGAIVWGEGSCARTATGRAPETASLAVIGAGEVPSAPGPLRTPPGGVVATPLAATSGPHGEIVVAGARSARAGAGQRVVQGTARGRFAVAYTGAGATATPALATAYLGDVALLSEAAPARDEHVLSLHIERYFAHDFAARASFSLSRGGPARGLTVALDYRTDALAVWAQGASVYARDMPARGSPHAAQRLGTAGSRVRIAALLSDDDRAIVAWSAERSGHTSVFLDMSATGVRFGAPRLLESFADPDGLTAPAGSPSLVRLSSEGVMMAWAGSRAGRWSVRAAAIDLNGLRSVDTISAPRQDALLTGLAPGPDGDAIVLWDEPEREGAGRPDLARETLLAARGIDAYPGRVIFAAPEVVAPAPLGGPARVALDPASDRALAVWRAAGGAIYYAIRAAPGG